MKAVILDDEMHCCEVLASLLKKHTNVKVTHIYQDPLVAVKELGELTFDILFLDIEMPFLNGFEVLNIFSDNQWKIIFTTAYDEHALKAFKVNAVDYLLKPIDKEDLVSAIEKVKDEDHVPTPQVLLDSVIHRIKKIAIPTLAGLEMIDLDDIFYLEAQSNYTSIVLEESKELTSRTLKSFAKLETQYGFIRVHNSYVVNPNRIRRYIKGDGGYLILDNGTNIPVSRSRKEALVKALNTF